MSDQILRKDDGFISTIFFNRQEKKNALNADSLFDFGDAVRDIEKEGKTRVIVLRGSGNKVFSSGVDLSGGPSEFNRTIEGLGYSIDNLKACSLPVISMIYGYAIGAGLDFSVISDFRIASYDAFFGAPLVKLGRTYYYSAIERLVKLVGLATAKEMLLTGNLMDASRAFEKGLVHHVYSCSDLELNVYQLARQIAEDAAPIAVRVTKKTIKKLFEDSRMDPDLGKELHEMVSLVNRSQDATEGIRAKLEKRKPVFTGK
jgi:enoyl-CoA hydratase/carnithine racemase